MTIPDSSYFRTTIFIEITRLSLGIDRNKKILHGDLLRVVEASACSSIDSSLNVSFSGFSASSFFLSITRFTVGNGPEFAGKVLAARGYDARVTPPFIRPRKPVENAYIESFNGQFRDECLNEEHYSSQCAKPSG